MFVCRRVWWSLPRYYKKKTTTKYNPLTILNNHFVCLFFFFVFLLSRDINHLNISRFLGAFNHVTLFTNAMGIDFVPWKPTTRDNRAYDRRSFIIRCEIISTSVFNWEKEKKKKKGRAKGKVSTSLSFFGCWPLESFLCVCVCRVTGVYDRAPSMDGTRNRLVGPLSRWPIYIATHGYCWPNPLLW